MTIDLCFQLCNFITNKVQNGNVTGLQFNLAAPIAQLSVINDRIGKVQAMRKDTAVNGYGFNASQRLREDLITILKQPTNILVIVSGGATLAPRPADYLYYDTMTTPSGVLMNECTADEIAIMNQSVITPPSTARPFFVMYQNGFYVYPTTLASVNLSYIRNPLTPVRNYIGDAYDPTGSQEFELPILVHNEILANILQSFGVNLSEAQIVQYGQMMEAAGK